MLKLAVIAAVAVLAAPQDQGHKKNEAREMMIELGGGKQGKALEAAIAAAAAYPLGSERNPVRENQPEGQRAYLKRLRCADGAAPAFERAGNVGEGPFGFIVDDYKVTCPGKAPVDIYIDMYHDGPENRPVPGFTIVG